MLKLTFTVGRNSVIIIPHTYAFQHFSEVEMKKLLCMLLVAVMVIGLVSCGSTLKDGEKGAMIKMCLTTLPDTFDPSAYAIDADSAKIYSLMYMGLTTINAKGQLSKGLAYEWGYYYDSIYEEDKMYFEIYDTGWNDGRRVSSSDFVYAWSRILSPESNSPYASMLYPIKNAKAVKMGDMTSDDLGLAAADDTRLEITFEDGYVKENGKDVAKQFATVVANIAFAPLREDKIDDNWTTGFAITDVMSCGPYALRGYSNTADLKKLELERNTFYRRDDEDEDEALDSYVIPYKLIYTYDNENNVLDKASEQYDAGDVFYLAEFNKATFEKYGKKVNSVNNLSSYVYYFNTTNKLFKDAKVREALSLAIDRTKVAEIVGCGAEAATGFVPSGVFAAGASKGKGFNDGSAIYSASADVDGAKKLLKEAGVSSGSFTISYIAETENEAGKLVAEYVAEAWGALGFKVKTKGIKADGKSVREVLANAEGDKFDVLAIDLAMTSVNAEAYLVQFANGYSGSAVNGADNLHFTGFNNKEYNELAAKVVAESDGAARAELLHEMEAMLAKQCPATALVFGKNSYVASSKLSDYGTYYNGAPTFFKTELKGWRDVNKKIEAEEAAIEEAAKDE